MPNQRKKRRPSRRLILILLGIALLFVVDRAYVFKIAAYSIDEKPPKASTENQHRESAHSPMLALIANGEDFIEAHEKTLAVLSAIAVAWFTGTLWRSTSGLFRMAETQGRDMRRSLKIAERSAQAMEKVATATKENAKHMGAMLQRQMRAYIHVNIGAVPQGVETVFQGTPELQFRAYPGSERLPRMRRASF